MVAVHAAWRFSGVLHNQLLHTLQVSQLLLFKINTKEFK